MARVLVTGMSGVGKTTVLDVVNPRAVTYSGTFHQWLMIGSLAIRILPTT
jgi:adenylate kinase